MVQRIESINVQFSLLQDSNSFLVSLTQQARISEMFLAFNLTLYSSIVDFADFLRIKPCPFLIVKGPVKCLNVFNVYKINKSISYVAVVKEVYRQIKKVELIFEFLVQCDQHLFLGVFVGDVSNHQCGPTFLHDLTRDDFKSIVVSESLTLIQVGLGIIIVLVGSLRVLPYFRSALIFRFPLLKFFFNHIHKVSFSYRTFRLLIRARFERLWKCQLIWTPKLTVFLIDWSLYVRYVILYYV